MGQGWWFLGCKSDVDEVLDILKNFYKGPDQDGVFVDIGANLGQVSENIIQTFGNIPWNRYKRKFGLDGLYCKNDPQPGAEIYMFEPQPNNAKRIRERMEYAFWHLERVHLIEAAVSNYTGTAEFVFTGEYSETGTLAEKANNKKDTQGNISSFWYYHSTLIIYNTPIISKRPPNGLHFRETSHCTSYSFTFQI